MSISTTSRAGEVYTARDATLGEFAASIAFEVGQPLAAISFNGGASLAWLDRNAPDLDEVRTLAARIVADALRAGDIVSRLWVLAAMAERRLAPPTDSLLYPIGAAHDSVRAL
jgi:C4-dicarboxylate-specific signal transduction histidine kinase